MDYHTSFKGRNLPCGQSSLHHICCSTTNLTVHMVCCKISTSSIGFLKGERLGGRLFSFGLSGVESNDFSHAENFHSKWS